MSERILVCRCEDVTAHEVEEAVQAGHRDLESLKRYTGFGTGVCQGKQCTALAARMLVQLGGEAPTIAITPRPPFHPVSVAQLAELEEAE